MTITSNEREAEQPMQEPSTENCEQIDHATSASICRAIGERLRENFQPDATGLPSRLQYLLDQIQRQDHDLTGDGSPA
jgi:hypothetical protein